MHGPTCVFRANLTPLSPQTQGCNAEPCAVCADRMMSPSCGELVANDAVIAIGGCDADMGFASDDYYDYAGQRLRDAGWCPDSCGDC